MRRQGGVAGARARSGRLTRAPAQVQSERPTARGGAMLSRGTEPKEEIDGEPGSRGAEELSAQLGGDTCGPSGHAARRAAAACSSIGAMSRRSPAVSITSRPMPMASRQCGRSRKNAPKTGSCCACMAAAMSPRRCTRTAKSMVIWPRRSAAARLIPHYRRAPEHVHPGPVDDAVTVYQWLLDQGMAAWPYRADRRFGGRRTRRHDLAAGARTQPADAGGHDATLTVGRHGNHWRDIESQTAIRMCWFRKKSSR